MQYGFENICHASSLTLHPVARQGGETAYSSFPQRRTSRFIMERLADHFVVVGSHGSVEKDDDSAGVDDRTAAREISKLSRRLSRRYRRFRAPMLSSGFGKRAESTRGTRNGAIRNSRKKGGGPLHSVLSSSASRLDGVCRRRTSRRPSSRPF